MVAPVDHAEPALTDHIVDAVPTVDDGSYEPEDVRRHDRTTDDVADRASSSMHRF
jgi:hypothetical protein